MRQSFARAGFLVAAILLALAGVMTMSGTAAAEKQPNSLDPGLTSNTFLRPCASPCGVQDAVGLAPGTDLNTYCRHNGYNVAYTAGRGGFVFRLRLEFPELQQEECAASGTFATVGITETLRSCNGPCVNFGTAEFEDILDIFCQLGPANDRWFLVYDNDNQRAGFLPKRALAQQQIVMPTC